MTAAPTHADDATSASNGRAMAPALATADKVSARRDELAAAALRTLAERGYANTSLREIAQNSEFSHGVLHYYFADKTELITHCVTLYKRRCVRRYDDVGSGASGPDDLVERFLAALLVTMHEDAHEQRLWYDLRVQSLVDSSFRGEVAEIDTALRTMVWRILLRYAELAQRALLVDADTAYALFDGVFSHAVQRHLAGADDVDAALRQQVRRLMPRLLDGMQGTAP
ncbi:TetR/AcrR family transcriptional regulator [Pseudactinotalea sp.]|uniref:TetR/AcrR family transcriptional regulator n=1 Tax=Pseudactinotalea sp. TaxID=1926260 RepID=UPI003B3B3555